MSKSNLKDTLEQNTQQKPIEYVKPLSPAEEKIKHFEDMAKDTDIFEPGDGSKYDARYVHSFCQLLNNSDIPKDEYTWKVLRQSSLIGKEGEMLESFDDLGKPKECFGKKFSSAEECLNVMHQIRTIRKLYGTCIDPPVTPEFDKLLNTIENGPKKVEYNGKKYDLSLPGMSAKDQMKYTGTLNEEIYQDVDLETKKMLRINTKYAQNHYSCPGRNIDIDKSEYLSRLYKLMELSGNPKIRRIKDSPAEGITGDRAHFIPDLDLSGGTCYSGAEGDLIPELSHAFRNKNNFFGETLQYTRDGLSDVLTLKNLGFTPKAQLKNYSDPDKMEHDTHSIVEPELNNYLVGKTPTVEQMYARINEKRKIEDNTYMPTLSAKKMIEKGYKQIEEDQKKTAQKAITGKIVAER